MTKIIADNPKEQDLADYLEAISQPYVKLVTEAHFASMVDGRIRAIKTEVVNDEIVHTVIFPNEVENATSK